MFSEWRGKPRFFCALIYWRAWPSGVARVDWRFPFGQALGWSLHEDFKSRGVFSFLSIAGAIGAVVLWRGAHGAEA